VGVLRVEFLGSLQGDLNVRLGHRLPQIRVDDVSAVAVKNAAQVALKRSANYDLLRHPVPLRINRRRILRELREASRHRLT
jgi:hypothetical protein